MRGHPDLRLGALDLKLDADPVGLQQRPVVHLAHGEAEQFEAALRGRQERMGALGPEHVAHAAQRLGLRLGGVALLLGALDQRLRALHLRLALVEAGHGLASRPERSLAGRTAEVLGDGGDDRPGLRAAGIAAAAARRGQEHDRPAEHAELDAHRRAAGAAREDVGGVGEATHALLEPRAVQHVAAHGVDVAREGVAVVGDGDACALAPADQLGVPGEPGRGGEEEVAVDAREAGDARDHRLRMREDDDERAALQRAHDLVMAAAQHLGRGGAVARPAVDDVRIGVGGVVGGGVEEFADGGEHALRVDGDGVVVEGGGRVEDGVVVDPPVGQGASDGEQAHRRLLTSDDGSRAARCGIGTDESGRS